MSKDSLIGMTSNAEVLFKKLSTSKTPNEVLAVIAALPEHEFCECKGGKSLKSGDVKRIWPEALSGFANTAGGVLIFGIDCREINVNTRTELDLLPDPESFRKDLDARILYAVEPHFSGIDYKVISSNGQGLVICFIPEGRAKPYAGRGRYFMRVRDSFTIIPQSFLRALFYPEQKARLLLEVKITGRKVGSGYEAAYTGFLMNVGNASALDLFCTANTSLSHGWSFPDRDWENARGYGVPAAGFNRPVHPSSLLKKRHFRAGGDFRHGGKLRSAGVGSMCRLR